MTSREIIKKLEQDGWFEVAQAGSHKQFKHAKKPGRVTVLRPASMFRWARCGALKSRPELNFARGNQRNI